MVRNLGVRRQAHELAAQEVPRHHAACLRVEGAHRLRRRRLEHGVVAFGAELVALGPFAPMPFMLLLW